MILSKVCDVRCKWRTIKIKETLRLWQQKEQTIRPFNIRCLGFINDEFHRTAFKGEHCRWATRQSLWKTLARFNHLLKSAHVLHMSTLKYYVKLWIWNTRSTHESIVLKYLGPTHRPPAGSLWVRFRGNSSQGPCFCSSNGSHKL